MLRQGLRALGPPHLSAVCRSAHGPHRDLVPASPARPHKLERALLGPVLVGDVSLRAGGGIRG
eukprot:629478-Prymnesium_polylepis.2